MTELILETALIWAVGALASTVTAGGGGAAAGALSAANLARIGANIARGAPRGGGGRRGPPGGGGEARAVRVRAQLCGGGAYPAGG
ncbi:hypothetical protein ABFW14_04610, partial [Mycolicibacterium fortuitum]